jgi:hypothetical protein
MAHRHWTLWTLSGTGQFIGPDALSCLTRDNTFLGWFGLPVVVFGNGMNYVLQNFGCDFLCRFVSNLSSLGPMGWSGTKNVISLSLSNSHVRFHHKVTIADFLQLFQTMVTKNDTLVAGSYYLPKRGHPQGLAPGPRAINLYFLLLDIVFAINLAHTKRGCMRLKKLSCHFRFVDDLVFLGHGIQLSD